MRDDQDWRAPELGEDGKVRPEAPPPTITGALANYAGRSRLAGSSLGVVMDDRQMRDAGVHPEQARGYSAIDATAASKAKSAEGYAAAFDLTGKMVSGAHKTASALAEAPTVARGIAAGKTVGAALGEAASHPMVKGLKALDPVYSVPLSIAGGVANGVADVQNGASVPDAIVGNVMRSGLVYGAGMIPWVGPAVALAADHYLPNGAAMGHAYHQSFADTDGRALLLP